MSVNFEFPQVAQVGRRHVKLTKHTSGNLYRSPYLFKARDPVTFQSHATKTSCSEDTQHIMSRSRQPNANSQAPSTSETTQEQTTRLTTLRLRGDDTPSSQEPSSSRRIRWSEDVVDNEGMGKKSSKGSPHPNPAPTPNYEPKSNRQPSMLHLPQSPPSRRK